MAFISPMSFTATLIAFILSYPIICAALRFQRLRSTRKRFPYSTKESFASMTDRDATAIQNIISEFEFPFTYEKALQFALFRTYGIPTISKLLVATSQLSNPNTACKRYQDTTILIEEFVGHEPNSERSRQAIARMNYIHSHYQKAGKISNSDMLYTLSLFACEPIRWIEQFEWRQLEDFEICAMGTFWKSIGDAMGIDFEEFEGGQKSVDGFEWLERIKQWSEGYEKEFMVPAKENHETAEETTKILLWAVPGWMKPFAKNGVSALMDDRLRKAMMYPPPPPLVDGIVKVTLGLRQFLLRHLSLPRPNFMRVHNVSSKADKHGHYFYRKYDAAPYYVKPTFWQRYQPMAWYLSYMGLPIPGDQGDKFHPQGYKITTMGPKSFEGKGEDYVEKVAEELRFTRTGGCVFAKG